MGLIEAFLWYLAKFCHGFCLKLCSLYRNVYGLCRCAISQRKFPDSFPSDISYSPNLYTLMCVNSAWMHQGVLGLKLLGCIDILLISKTGFGAIWYSTKADENYWGFYQSWKQDTTSGLGSSGAGPIWYDLTNCKACTVSCGKVLCSHINMNQRTTVL